MQTNTPTAPIQLVPGNTLITATPEEGRHLAVKMARLIIKLTQPDEAKRVQMLAYRQAGATRTPTIP
jgi:Hexameric tyrosine-coordinated heme protein (HTHP)